MYFFIGFVFMYSFQKGHFMILICILVYTQANLFQNLYICQDVIRHLVYFSCVNVIFIAHFKVHVHVLILYIYINLTKCFCFIQLYTQIRTGTVLKQRI